MHSFELEEGKEYLLNYHLFKLSEDKRLCIQLKQHDYFQDIELIFKDSIIGMQLDYMIHTGNFIENVKSDPDYYRIDWSNVKPRTKILVRNDMDDEWEERIFLYHNNLETIHTIEGDDLDDLLTTVCIWNYGKLLTDIEEEK